VAGGLVLAPVALLVEGPPPALTAANVAGHLYLGLLGTALAYALWFRGLRALPATDVTFLGLLSPVVATAAGWVVAGQALTAGQLMGAAVVLAALAAGQTPPRHPATPVPPPPDAPVRSCPEGHLHDASSPEGGLHDGPSPVRTPGVWAS
jgi:probable blue pigment (indigoidine) exporter